MAEYINLAFFLFKVVVYLFSIFLAQLFMTIITPIFDVLLAVFHFILLLPFKIKETTVRSMHMHAN